ncbi:efflux RND transporter periplasmic adaptor subunit [candidate division KSB1 bacterium]|nr:efflux RND transporter periplasmic adaptor subunit [candidate division KSB1 bacterium]
MNFQSAQILTGVRHEEVVASKTGFSSALNAHERAKLNLSRLTITAPFTGIIGDLNVQPGQYVSPSTECCKIVDLSRVRINVGVLESEIQHLKIGRAASIELPAYPDEKFTGKIVTINPIINPENKTFRVCVELDNPNYKIKAGMFAYVKLDAQIYHDKLLVPRTAILTRDQRTLIFIIRKNEDGKNLAKWSYVDTGLENEEYVEILKSNLGLDAGEQVITSGHYTLAHDAEVRVVSGE